MGAGRESRQPGAGFVRVSGAASGGRRGREEGRRLGPEVLLPGRAAGGAGQPLGGTEVWGAALPSLEPFVSKPGGEEGQRRPAGAGSESRGSAAGGAGAGGGSGGLRDAGCEMSPRKGAAGGPAAAGLVLLWFFIALRK